MIPYINRELSWLEFNQRVLVESKRSDLPLLERVKFLAISASNLDEFFQVRVGGLSEQQQREEYTIDPSGLTLSEQLFKARERALVMMQEQYEHWKDTLQPQLDVEGISFLNPSQVSGDDMQKLKDKVQRDILPLLTPIALQYEESSISIPALQQCLICQLQSTDQTVRNALIPIPPNLKRFLVVRETLGEVHYILIEDVVIYFLSELFPAERIIDCSLFRLTKNSDIILEDEEARDLAGEMAEVLKKRRHGQPVRVEIPCSTSATLREVICKQTGASEGHLIELAGPLGLADFFKVAVIPGFEQLKYKPWGSQQISHVREEASIFKVLDERSLLLFHPYESFEPVVRMIEEAAEDPDTLAIKQVLYRTASKSRIIEALKKAALNGKQVTVIIELKARFDEARNLVQADELQRAGVQVIYGVKGFKTHAKATLIIRKTTSGIRRYLHLGTGNYNETTASLYTDVSYLTSNPELGSDTSLFFNMLTGHSKMTRFYKLRPAPTHMKKTLLELIDQEADYAKNGQKARIMAKMNSLQDPEIIAALYQASNAGVEILLNVRGICCLRPHVEGYSENIRVVSIIDRYLEHTRAFLFEQAGEERVFISSADWMVRNLNKRLELMIPIEEEEHKKRIRGYLEACFLDDTHAHSLLSDGRSVKVNTNRENPFRFQEFLYQKAKQSAELHEISPLSFQPHNAPNTF